MVLLHGSLTAGVGYAQTYDFEGQGARGRDLKAELTLTATRAVVRRLRADKLDLSGLRTAAPLILEDCVIGVLDLSDAHLASLTVRGGSVLQLRLQRAYVAGALELSRVTVESLDAHFLKAPGDVAFDGARFTSGLNLEFAILGSWISRGVTWPEEAGGLRLHGLRYRYWLLGDSWREQVALLDRAVRSEQVYLQLEQMFHEQGYHHRGDAAFLAWKRRDQADRWHAGGLDNRLAAAASLALDALVGHGRAVWRAGIWALALVLLGGLLCADRRHLQPVGAAPAGYQPLVFALDWFLPLVDLRVASRWQVDPARRLTWLYLRGLSLAGWILVPLAVLGAFGALD